MTEQNPTTTTYEIERLERLTNDGGGHVFAWVLAGTPRAARAASSASVFREWIEAQDNPDSGCYRIIERSSSNVAYVEEFAVNLVTSVEIERIEHRHDQLARDIAALSEAAFIPAPTSDEG